MLRLSYHFPQPFLWLLSYNSRALACTSRYQKACLG
jgi:hypothetical protein